MKTAVSIPDKMFEEVDRYARKHHHSRSEVFVMALKEFLGKRESRKLLDALNEAYADAETAEEETAKAGAKSRYARKVLKEKY